MSERRLVIVESPAKAKTIAGYLGDGYVVESSIGHIRDLPNRAADIPKDKRARYGTIGVAIEHDFEPLYIVDADKRRVVTDLRKQLCRGVECCKSLDRQVGLRSSLVGSRAGIDECVSHTFGWKSAAGAIRPEKIRGEVVKEVCVLSDRVAVARDVYVCLHHEEEIRGLLDRHVVMISLPGDAQIATDVMRQVHAARSGMRFGEACPLTELPLKQTRPER